MAIQQLCEVLETLLQQHEQLQQYAEQKKAALIQNDVNLLNETVNKEARLIKLISDAELKRHDAVYRFYQEKGFQATSSTKVADVIRMVTNSQDKLRLLELSERLTSVVYQLKALNDLNMTLIQQAIEINDFSLNILAGSFEPQDFVYKKPTDYSQSGMNLKFFDSRA
ncbi:MAG: flagellar export chaperone FlgN [Candidatus Cohnella colombiensis]|uniref:Flagellar export chaperone FlgN n=1 Tax=Candidatus Cohnella colombiensis TaxID=3121368 RepID=A0AA95JF61_9BACL|nr:MAG: flagellar export chaperone FlgN [Cohnella sp.]